MAFGLASLLLGTVIAVSLVPEYVEDPGTMFTPAVTMAIAMFLPIAVRLRRNISNIVRVENILLLGLFYWLLMDLVQSAYPLLGLRPQEVRIAFASIGSFAVAIWIGSSGRGWPLPNQVRLAIEQSITQRGLFVAVLLSFILGMANFAWASGFSPTIMLDGLMQDRWGAPWTRGSHGDFDAIFQHLIYFGLTLPSLAVLVGKRSGWLNVRTLLCFILASIMMLFVAQSGDRRVVGVCLGAALATWFIGEEKLRPRVVFATFGASALLLYLLQEMLRYRNLGFTAIFSEETPSLHFQHLHVDDNFYRLTQLISIFPDLHSYVWHHPIFHALTLVIPRVLWPGKPTGPGYDLSQLIGFEGASLSTSIIGELYASFGLVAVLLGGLLIGRLAGMWNKCLMMKGGTFKPLVFGLGLMVLFGGLRSLQALVQMSYIILGWLVIAAVVRQRERRALARVH